MNNFTHLSFRERETISKMLFAGATLVAIGEILRRPASTVSRDMTKNGMNRETYFALDADFKSDCRKEQSKRPKKIENNWRLREYIHFKMSIGWSPEQIAKRLKRVYAKDASMRISHETIYMYLYCLPRGQLKKELMSYLRQKRTLRNKRGNTNEKRGQIPDLVSIHERPKETEDRTIPGHWEGDLIVGPEHKSALGTLVERTTRTVILVPLMEKDATSVREAFEKELKSLPKQMKLSMTYDRGKEMSEHKLFTEHTEMKVYFADPYSPWQRGTNENTNGLIREYFPKGTDFRNITRAQIKKVQDLLNGRPRKVLAFETPYEVFTRLINQTTLR